jgi:hypothetical protein
MYIPVPLEDAVSSGAGIYSLTVYSSSPTIDIKHSIAQNASPLKCLCSNGEAVGKINFERELFNHSNSLFYGVGY